MVSSIADAYITTGKFDYTDDQTIQELEKGEHVKQADGTIYKYIGDSQLIETNYDYSTVTDVYKLSQDDTVRLSKNIGEAKAGDIYKYVGEDRPKSETAIDLSAEDYTDTNNWVKINNPLNINLSEQDYTDTANWEKVKTIDAALKIAGTITISSKDDASIQAKTNMKSISSTTNDGGASLVGGLLDAVTSEYKYSSTSGEQTIKKDDYVRVASDHASGGVTKAIYRYKGTADTVIDLSKEDFSVRDTWERVLRTSASDAIPNIGNITGSDSQAFGGIVLLKAWSKVMGGEEIRVKSLKIRGRTRSR